MVSKIVDEKLELITSFRNLNRVFITEFEKIKTDILNYICHENNITLSNNIWLYIKTPNWYSYNKTAINVDYISPYIIREKRTLQKS